MVGGGGALATDGGDEDGGAVGACGGFGGAGAGSLHAASTMTTAKEPILFMGRDPITIGYCHGDGVRIGGGPMKHVLVICAMAALLAASGCGKIRDMLSERSATAHVAR